MELLKGQRYLLEMTYRFIMSDVLTVIRNKDTLPAMREECSSIINGGLRTVTRSNSAVMNYVNYDTQIIQRYQVKLVGYTYQEFTSPYNISVVDDLRLLRDALQCGLCCWIRLTKGEVSKHTAEMSSRVAAGEKVMTKRKVRVDKGKKRGKRTATDLGAEDKENDDIGGAGPSKRRKVTASAPKTQKAPKKAAGKKRPTKSQLPPSNEFITTEEELTDEE